jgi:hypothetical protein
VGRLSKITLTLVAISLLLFSALPASAAPIRRAYAGQTSDGNRIAFRTAEFPNGRIDVTRFSVRTTLACQDGTTRDIGFTFGLAHTGSVLEAGYVLSVDFVEDWVALHVQGELRLRQGSGTFRLTMPILTDDEQGQICTTGDLTWEVLREVGRPRS